MMKINMLMKKKLNRHKYRNNWILRMNNNWIINKKI